MKFKSWIPSTTKQCKTSRAKTTTTVREAIYSENIECCTAKRNNKKCHLVQNTYISKLLCTFNTLLQRKLVQTGHAFLITITQYILYSENSCSHISTRSKHHANHVIVERGMILIAIEQRSRYKHSELISALHTYV